MKTKKVKDRNMRFRTMGRVKEKTQNKSNFFYANYTKFIFFKLGRPFVFPLLKLMGIRG